MGVVRDLPNVAEASDLGTEAGVVRRLSSRSVPTYLERVRASNGRPYLIVVERFERGDAGDEQVDAWVRDAHLGAALEHENVVRARAIVVGKDEIRIACDLVDGERLRDLPPVPPEIALRILIDVLTGLAAIHKLKDSSGQHRHKLVHGEVTADNVLVGLDGVSRLLRTCRVRSPHQLDDGIEAHAPEVLAGEHVDQRADVFSVGALLRQALAGAPLGDDGAWASPLADVAARALEAAPEKRFPTATAMVTELRRIAGDRLATNGQVASLVEAEAGSRIAARRAPLRSSETRLRTMPPPEHPTSEIEQLPSLCALPSLTRTLPPPAFDAAPANEVTPEFVELDESDLTTLPPSMPPEDDRAKLSSVPPAPALGAWASLIAADPTVFSLPPVTDVTWPPEAEPAPVIAEPVIDRWRPAPQRGAVAVYAAAALVVTASWGIVRAFQGRSPAPALLAAPAPPPPIPPPETPVGGISQGGGEAGRSERDFGFEKQEFSSPPRLPVKSPESVPDRPAAKTASRAPAPSAARSVRTERARRAEAAAPKVPVAPPSFAGLDLAGEFDRSAAMQALREAGDRARTCLVHVAAPGPLRVAVTFARTGAVSAAVVEGSLAGTAPGTCVEGKFRSLRIPPFRGSSLTVRKTIAF